MENYNTSSNKLDPNSIKKFINQKHTLDNKNIRAIHNTSKHKWKNNSEIKEYLNNSKINSSWYHDTDKKLQPLVIEFMKLTNHSHYKVRLELCIMCELLINKCFM